MNFKEPVSPGSNLFDGRQTLSKNLGKSKSGQVLLAAIPTSQKLQLAIEEWQYEIQCKLLQSLDLPEFFWLPGKSIYIELIAFGEVASQVQKPLKKILEDFATLEKDFSLQSGTFNIVQKFKEQFVFRLEFENCPEFKEFKTRLENKINEHFGTHFGNNQVSKSNSKSGSSVSVGPSANIGEVFTCEENHTRHVQNLFLEQSKLQRSLFQEVTQFELLRTQPIFHNNAFTTEATFFLGQNNSLKSYLGKKDMM